MFSVYVHAGLQILAAVNRSTQLAECVRGIDDPSLPLLSGIEEDGYTYFNTSQLDALLGELRQLQASSKGTASEALHELVELIQANRRDLSQAVWIGSPHQTDN